jgi:glycerol-3-phosphate dehydrogenase subunit C
MREGSLEAPTRHPIRWQDEDFYDPQKLDAELRRVFDICHGCRRCFNLCDSFPRLFDLIDESETGELDAVDSANFKPVADACTLCDMCFMTKCPYVPPHEFDLDFPHLMVRYRAVEKKQGKVPFTARQLTETDRNGKLAAPVAPLANWATKCGNTLTRPVLESVAGVHRDAHLPEYHGKTFAMRARKETPEVNRSAPAFGRKAVLYATCFINYNNPDIGAAARSVLARNGVETEVVYPSCCGMPQLEHGDLARVAANARKIAAELKPWIDKGYDVVSLVPSCSLMLKFEWPLIEPEDDNVTALSQATFDVAEYVVDMARKEGLADGLKPLDGGVTMHIACHARAQNMGQKATEMLKLLPDTEVKVIERCSGHGGSWGIMKDNFEVALKVGRPVAREAAENKSAFVVSECPLARDHVVQGIERLDGGAAPVETVQHPIELIARAYGV